MFEIREEMNIRGQGSEVRGQGVLGPFDPMARLEPLEPQKYKSVVIKLNFEGANRVIPIGQRLLQHRSNFFYGNDSSKWCTDVLNFQEIIYENIYDKIDLRYYSTSKGLKYDFIVYPGADIKQIKMKYEGIDGLEIDQSENLIIKTGYYVLIDSDLFIYQNCSNIQKPIM